MNKLEEHYIVPKDVVAELDKYIIGQDEAKKLVSIALVNRYIRSRLPKEIKDEVMPKNIIMIGSTGIGKTEIARRLSKLIKAPFIKVEATKYTEVGYVGRDVESMVRDLMSIAVNMVKEEMYSTVRDDALVRTEERIVDSLFKGSSNSENMDPNEIKAEEKVKEKLRKKLRAGELDDTTIEIQISSKMPFSTIEIFTGGNFEEIDMGIGGLLGNIFDRKKKRELKIKKAKEIILAEELEKLVDHENISDIAKSKVENMGIIFIDEIDKIAAKNRSGNDVSREGVQRDILPIIEGSKVNTKYGIVDTSHILFIAAGAFNLAKPSDLIPELQGRFPIKVELKSLSIDDLKKILKQTKNSLIKQYVAMFKVYDLDLKFSEEAIDRIAELTFNMNLESENLGARRLHGVMEIVLADLFFEVPGSKLKKFEINLDYVNKKIQINEQKDLNYYII
ncbi:HslU--HslV peptidase ATPase subunit [Borreliella burgdorferi]|uniref:ATP-dependent protease ATPase subunit HslU n=2 Tax=Borreliella burgdorferi TaxID=139 RepID=HSLU_BORBU|nr:HslU--HslV peptidase ATPase subunit [Borreliella burgdorferi]Q44772.1 RecName: Full=ATP-dependent protease ATPase subunit HslU; AltName: Full=Unfoldase HslU [Borreliella burgdorferi B31]AGS66314.1 ATP-dependent protease ATP-binding subunit HslU [Borreliella burgdorferi CA382]AAA85618.1 HsLU [Borreliella burgdorferi]AAC66653.2 heat shock protein HslVU, ATPase subunit HslU [Borreliella burgdorferi B31]ADQ29174.1 heat shock protein HslVU, ATPase subunit HslU [Borreliella burgdorferi N40]ARS30